MTKADIAKVFTSLSNVKEIWLTDDGHYHLHPHNGGEKVTRDDIDEEVIEEKQPEEPVIIEEDKTEEITEENSEVIEEKQPEEPVKKNAKSKK